MFLKRLQYVAYPDDFRQLDILLADAISGELAIMLAATLVHDPDKFGMITQVARMKLNEAKAIDTLENKFIDQEASVWNDARAEALV